MASPPALHADELHDSAPLDGTTSPFTHTLSHPADTSAPPSPSALAAATTLAALADDRPLPTLPATHDYANYYDIEDDDDDYSGGISITSTDLQEYASGHPMADTYMTEQDVAEHLESILAPQPLLPQETLPTVSQGLAMYAMNFEQPHVFSFSGHNSSSDPALYWGLDPLPPAFQEGHLAIEDNGSFTDITAFFDRIAPQRPTVPGLDLVEVPAKVTRDQLQGDRFDYQGIDWLARSTTRSYVRAKRAEFENARLLRRLNGVRNNISPIPNSDNFFRFKRNNTAHKAYFPHFQLRNVLAATSRNDIYYAAGHHVLRTDAEDWQKDVIIDFSNRLSIKGSITTIASAGDVLIAGAFDGEYAIADLSSSYGASPTFGRTNDLMVDTRSRIVNHMHLFEGRTTYQPQAVLCSNDHHLRVLDCATNTFVHNFQFPAAVNCSATSPNGRLRVAVGDFQETLITNAETGAILEMLASHTDDVFACAWADDGIHVATAAQDSTISIWDARNWGRVLKAFTPERLTVDPEEPKPLTSFASEIGITRSLRFSPVGSGPRVLVAAEADDYISVINAQTFESKQVFDFFGPIGGITFTPDGQSLFVANGEKTFGGIVELDRTGWAERTAERKPDQNIIWDDLMTDWVEDDRLDSHDRTLSGEVERERRCVDFGDMII